MNAMKQILVLVAGVAAFVLLVGAGKVDTTSTPSRLPQRPIVQAACGQGPTNPAITKTVDLDESAPDWGIYCDGEGVPTPIMENVSTPSIDGKSLHCGIAGGDPYSNVHCYRNLLSEPATNVFTLTLTFWFSPTMCNDQQSKVQALEFTMNKWYHEQRYEFAVQWLNVGAGAPQWRYWDPHQPAANRWVPLNPPFTQCLQGGNQPHTLTLEGTIDGSIVDGRVHYRRLTVDGQSRALAITLAPADAQGVPDGLAVGVQLDGNVVEDPYDVYVDQVRFIRRAEFRMYLPAILN